MRITALITLLGVVVSSCVNSLDANSDFNDQQVERIPITLSSNFAQLNSKTRMSGDSFDEGDKVGLFLMKQPQKLSGERYLDNEMFTYSSGMLTSSEQLYYPDDYTLCDFIAYYPYQQEASAESSGVIKLHAQSDQSTAIGFAESDFLLAAISGVKPSIAPVQLDFRHLLSKIDIVVEVPAKSQVDEILSSLVVKLDNVYGEASYNVETNLFASFASSNVILPYGTWQLNQDKTVLTGKKAIVIPQSQSNLRIILQVGGRTFTNSFPTSIKLESGINYVLKLTYDPSIGVGSIIPTIKGWDEDLNEHESTLVEDNASKTTLPISTLTFSETSVIQIFNSASQLMGNICKEYLLNESVASAALVYYPAATPGVGTVLQLLNETSDIHGGKVTWNDNNTFSYVAGDKPAITIITLDAQGELIDNPNDDSPSIYAAKYLLLDNRGTKTDRYGVVKIGAQYWMREELRATAYNDGSAISDNSSELTTAAAGLIVSRGNYYYNFAAMNTLKMAPAGWSIPNKKQWDALFSYLRDETSFLKSPGWTTVENVSAGNNLSGFGCMPIGFFYNTNSPTMLLGVDQSASFWQWGEGDYLTTEDLGINITCLQDAHKGVKYTDYSAYSIRCVRD